MKHKQCCAVKRAPSHWFAIVAVAGFVVLATWVVVGAVRQSATDGLAPPGKVWSAEHGHWHDAAGSGIGVADGAPVGKVWSEEHGHWHDAAPGDSLPPGPAPAGKVWSAEHGHWHDASGAEPPGTSLP